MSIYRDPFGTDAAEDVGKTLEKVREALERYEEVKAILEAGGEAVTGKEVFNVASGKVKGLPAAAADNLKAFSENRHCMAWYESVYERVNKADECIAKRQIASAKSHCRYINSLNRNDNYQNCVWAIEMANGSFMFRQTFSLAFQKMAQKMKDACVAKCK